MRLRLCFMVWALGAAAAWSQQTFVPTVIATPGYPSSTLYGTYGGTLVRSMDLGKTWTPLYVTEAGLPQPPVRGFAVDPTDPNTIYLATTIAAGTFWKSTDSGNTWIHASAGLPNTGSVDLFDMVSDSTGTYLYLKISSQIYRSSNSAVIWVRSGTLPTSSGVLVIAPSDKARMYYIDAPTLQVYVSTSEGVGWDQTAPILGGAAAAEGDTIAATGVPFYDETTLYVALNIGGSGVIVPYAVSGNGPWIDQRPFGLGAFSQLVTANTGPSYALTNLTDGTYRSYDGGKNWSLLGVGGLDHYTTTAVDPVYRTTLFGVHSTLLGTGPAGTPNLLSVTESTDSGTTWKDIPSTILPTIAKPVPSFNITLEQDAPYSAAFSIQTVESAAWKTPVTISTSGESWLQIATTSGTTPLANTLTISTMGLMPGVYTSTITISAPQSFNKSVSIPVQLTIKPAGALGPGYLITTAAGNGNPGGVATTGTATGIGIGAPNAVTIDPSGKVDFSAGNRIWQLDSGTVTALAGNGANASNGDGTDPLGASLANPDAIAFDSSGALYFTEFATGKVRKFSQGAVNTVLNMSTFNQNVGSHNLVIDPVKFMLFAVPESNLHAGIIRYDGNKLLNIIPWPFSNPYAMIEDGSGNLWVSDMGLNQVFKISAAGIVSVVAGTGFPGFGGDGGPAAQAMLSAPAGLALDSQGTLYIADSGNNRIRTVTPDGNIHTIAGSGLPGFAGDNSTADYASFLNPMGIAVDAAGNVYVADSGNNRLRVLMPQATPLPQIDAVLGPDRATSLAPGGIFVIYGHQLAPPNFSQETNTNTWPRSMGNVSVTINGVVAPLYYVSTSQINGQVPFETPVGTATAMVATNGSLPAQKTFTVLAAQPDVLAQGGGSQAVAVNQDGTINSPSAPAHPGDVEVVYLSGIGVPHPSVPTGEPSPSTLPLAMVNYPYQITLNGTPAPSSPYDYLGYAPGFPALEQANFKLPPGLTGDLTLIIMVNGVPSAPTTLTVR